MKVLLDKTKFFKKFSSKLCFFVFCSFFPAFSLALPYETTCSEDQKDRTVQFSSSSTEAGFCFQCEANSWSSSTFLMNLKTAFFTTIPKECFLAIAIRGNKTFGDRYNYCSEESNRHHLAGADQKFCINEDYVTAVHSAFKRMSYCFNFDKQTQENIFHLINRESGGILNARSTTGARCLGQITQNYVETINNVIATANNKNPHEEIFIWKDLLKRCPDLKSAQINDIESLNCSATQNPEKCLFYSFFGKQRSLYNIQKRLDAPHGFMGNREFPQPKELIPKAQSSARQKYQNFLKLLPMKGKEMMKVRATLKDGRKVDWMLWDDSEIYNNDLHKKIDWTKNVELKKINIFQNERDIKTMFMYWSHNGGHSLSRSGFQLRLENLKKAIAKGGCQENKELRCQMRRKLEKGEKIPNSLALKFFQKDLRWSYGGNTRRKKEVSNYVQNVIDSRSLVFDTTEKSKNNNLMLKYHKKNGIDKETARQFIEHTDKICPKTIKLNH